MAGFTNTAPGTFDLRVWGVNGSGIGLTTTITSQAPSVVPSVAADIGAAATLIASAFTGTTATVTIGGSNDNETAWKLDIVEAGAYIGTVYLESLALVAVLSSLTPSTPYRVDCVPLGFTSAGVMLTGSTVVSVSFVTTATGAGSIVGVDFLAAAVGAQMTENFTLSPVAAATVTWLISGPGSAAITGTGLNNGIGQLLGTPSTPGVFDEQISASWIDTGLVVSRHKPIRVIVDGGPALSWLNNVASRLDLQADVSTRALFSSKLSGGAAGLFLKTGDAFDAYFLFRDGAVTVTRPIDALVLTISLADNHSAPALLEIRPSPLTVEFLGGFRVYRVTGSLKSPLLNDILDRLNREGSTLTNALPCQMEASWRTAGVWTSSQKMPVTLVQDATRN